MTTFSYEGFDIELNSLSYAYSGKSGRASLSVNGSVNHSGMHCRFRIEGSRKQHRLVFDSAVTLDPDADTRKLAIGIKNALIDYFGRSLEIPESMRKILIRCVMVHHLGQGVES